MKLASVTEEVFPTGSERLLKGSYRFGAMTKNLVTKDNLFGEILLIANKHPDAEVLNSVADTLKGELKVIFLGNIFDSLCQPLCTTDEWRVIVYVIVYVMSYVMLQYIYCML